MDAYENMMKHNRKKRVLRAVLLGIGIPSLLLAALFLFLFVGNHFRIDVTLWGESELILQYAQPYREPGASAMLSGDFLLTRGKALPVTTEGTVDTGRVGTYPVKYTARYLFWSGSACRTVRVVDETPPQIILKGRPETYVIPGQSYREEGYIARDDYDGDLTDRVQRMEKNGFVYYRVSDSSGNTTELERKIVYYDPVVPEIKLLGSANLVIPAGEAFTDPGCTAFDNCDGDLTSQIRVSGSVNVYRSGTYTLCYTVFDRFGNQAAVSRTVTVQPKPQPDTVVPDGKVVYLTFDDGPGPYTRKLLDVLKKYNVKATFFVINSDYADLISDIAAEGHSVGIHSVSHSYKTIYASEDAYFRDLYQMQNIIQTHTGITTTLVRFPGGSSNTVSRFNTGIMTRLTRALNDMGFQYFDWNVDSDDAGKTHQTEKVVENGIAGIKRHTASVVLQHDVKPYSVDAVEEIICWGLANGYSFLPLDSTSPTAHHGVNN